MVKNVIQSVKHIIQNDSFTVAAAALDSKVLAIAVRPADVNLVNEVEEGSLIKAIWLEYWVTSDDAANGFFTITFEKRNTTQSTMTFAEGQILSNYTNKKNIFYITQGQTSPNTGTPTPAMRGWFKIPKGKQRMGIGDQLVVNFAGISNGITVCGVAIYKGYK